MSELDAYAHARIDALQREVAYILALLAAGQDPQGRSPHATIADRMADIMLTFAQADNYVKPQNVKPQTHIAIDNSTHSGPAHPCSSCDAMTQELLDAGVTCADKDGPCNDGSCAGWG